MEKKKWVLIAGVVVIALIVLFGPKRYYNYGRVVPKQNVEYLRSRLNPVEARPDFPLVILYSGLTALATGVGYVILRKK